MAKEKTQNYELVPYEISKNNLLQVKQADETVWLTQNQIAQLFDTTKQNVGQHIKNIFIEGELIEDTSVKNFFTVLPDGRSYNAKHYNLDVIISVGYRIKSQRGTQFRQWATKVLKEKMLQQYAQTTNRISEMYEKQLNILSNRCQALSEQLSNQNYLIFKLEERQNCLEGKHSNNVSVIKHVFEVYNDNLSVNSQTINYLEKRISLLEKKLANARRKTVTVLTV